MAFVLSKVLLIFLFPLTWVFVILIFAFVIRNQVLRKRALFTAFTLLYLFSIPLLLDLYAKAWDYPPAKLSLTAKYSCVIVLGGFTGEKADKSGYFNPAADRLIQGIELQNTGKAANILITSGDGSLNPDGFSEAVWVKNELKKLNIPDSTVLIEGKSRNTIENAVFTKRMLDAKHLAPPYLLVTSAFHMRRAMVIFKKAGLDVIPYPANYIAGIGKNTVNSILPSADALSTWDAYTKELVGIIVAKLRSF